MKSTQRTSPRALTGNVVYNYFHHPCSYRVHLDLLGDRAERSAPSAPGRYLMACGRRHETEVFAGIRAEHPEDWAEIAADPELGREADIARRVAATEEAMRRGVGFIFHGFLSSEPGEVAHVRAGGEPEPGALVMRGETDLLVRVDDPPSELGAWSYVVGDVKSSRHARFSQQMQVTFYSWLLARVQGVMPRSGFVVTGDGRKERFDIDDTLWTLRHFVEEEVHEYLDPEAVFYQVEGACRGCHWKEHCERRAEAEDDVSLVPGARRSDKRTLIAAGIRSRADLRSQTDAALRSLGRSWGNRLDGFRDLKQRASAQEFGTPILRKDSLALSPSSGGSPDPLRHRGPFLLVAAVADPYDGRDVALATALVRRGPDRGLLRPGASDLTFLHQDRSREALHLFGLFLGHVAEIEALLRRGRQRALPILIDRGAAFRLRRSAEASSHPTAVSISERFLSDAVLLPRIVDRLFFLPREARDPAEFAAALAPRLARPAPPRRSPLDASVFDAFARGLGDDGEEAPSARLRARLEALARDLDIDPAELLEAAPELRPLYLREWRAGGDPIWLNALRLELADDLEAGLFVLEAVLGAAR